MGNELVPIVGGLILGSFLTLVRSRLRLVTAVGISVVLGVLATILSGEYRIGWEFLLIDIPLVAVCSAVGFATVRGIRDRRSAPGRPAS